MKAKEIQVGGVYQAKVNGRLTRVKVRTARVVHNTGLLSRDRTVWDVLNLATGRVTTFRSSNKFREEIEVEGNGVV